MSPYIEIENEYGTFRMKHEEFVDSYTSFANATESTPSYVKDVLLEFLESLGKI